MEHVNGHFEPEYSYEAKDFKDYKPLIHPEMDMLANPKFVAFVTDLAINTVDTSKSTTTFDFLSEDDPFNTPVTEQNFDPETMGNENPTSFRFDYRDLPLPVLDRFLALMHSLKDPSFIRTNKFQRQKMLVELGMSLNANNKEERAMAFKLVDNDDFMLKYQLVALSKFHNYFGSMDHYMREFARIMVDSGDR